MRILIGLGLAAALVGTFAVATASTPGAPEPVEANDTVAVCRFAGDATVVVVQVSAEAADSLVAGGDVLATYPGGGYVECHDAGSSFAIPSFVGGSCHYTGAGVPVMFGPGSRADAHLAHGDSPIETPDADHALCRP